MNVGVTGTGRKKLPISMNMCFWCGECKEIIMGQKFVDESKEIPSEVCLDTEPCDKCKEQFAKGIHVMGVVHGEQYEGELFPAKKKDNLYLTGTSFVCKEESDFVQNLPESIKAGVLKTKKLFMDDDIVKATIEEYNKAYEGEDNE